MPRCRSDASLPSSPSPISPIKPIRRIGPIGPILFSQRTHTLLTNSSPSLKTLRALRDLRGQSPFNPTPKSLLQKVNPLPTPAHTSARTHGRTPQVPKNPNPIPAIAPAPPPINHPRAHTAGLFKSLCAIFSPVFRPSLCAHFPENCSARVLPKLVSQRDGWAVAGVVDAGRSVCSLYRPWVFRAGLAVLQWGWSTRASSSFRD